MAEMCFRDVAEAACGTDAAIYFSAGLAYALQPAKQEYECLPKMYKNIHEIEAY